MSTTRSLLDEHRLILGALGGLETLAARAGAGEIPKRKDVAEFVEFFAQFADGCHRGKEEDILFAALADSGYPLAHLPLQVMEREHAMGRRMLRELRALAELPRDWLAEDGERFAGAAHRYASLLRDHIRKEDEIIFPMAEAQLGPEDLARVDELCGYFETERNAAGLTDRLERLAWRLIARYPAAPTTARPPSEPVSSCCGL